MQTQLTAAQTRRILAFALGAVLLTTIDFKLLAVIQSWRPYLKGDLYYVLRIWGTLWTWILISVALLLALPRPPADRPARSGPLTPGAAAARVLLGAGFAGLLAELLKLVIRRERPSELEAYVFRSLSERPWSSSGLGLPSSHAAVAFGGSLALITLFPRLRWPALVMAIGCGLSRIASGAHYPTDVLAGAFVGWVTSQVVAIWLARPAITTQA